MRDYSVAGVRFGSLIGLTRGAWVGLPQIWGVLKLWLGARGGVGTSCNLVLQYLVSGGEAPVLAAKTLVLRAITGVGREGGGGVGVEEGGGGVGVEEGGRGGNSISTPLRLRSAQLALHLGNELGEELVDRFKCLAVAFLGELKIVPHVMVGDTLVNLNEASVNVNELQPTVALGQITKQGVHLSVSFSEWIWQLTPWEKCQENKECLRLFAPYDTTDLFDSLCDLFGRVSVVVLSS